MASSHKRSFDNVLTMDSKSKQIKIVMPDDSIITFDYPKEDEPMPHFTNGDKVQVIDKCSALVGTVRSFITMQLVNVTFDVYDPETGVWETKEQMLPCYGLKKLLPAQTSEIKYKSDERLLLNAWPKEQASEEDDEDEDDKDQVGKIWNCSMEEEAMAEKSMKKMKKQPLLFSGDIFNPLFFVIELKQFLNRKEPLPDQEWDRIKKNIASFGNWIDVYQVTDNIMKWSKKNVEFLGGLHAENRMGQLKKILLSTNYENVEYVIKGQLEDWFKFGTNFGKINTESTKTPLNAR